MTAFVSWSARPRAVSGVCRLWLPVSFRGVKCLDHLAKKKGYCRNNLSSSRCRPELRLASSYTTEGCHVCVDQSLRDLRNDLTERHGRKVEQLQAETENKVKQLQAEINFLKLNNVVRKPSNGNSLEVDLEIEVQGCVLHAHRLILADKSTVFRKMFDIQMAEKGTGVVRVQGTTLFVMRAVIDFCYTSDISFTDEATPAEVLKVAHKYNIGHLRDVCATELVTEVNDENLAEMLRLSTLCDAKDLQEAALHYLKANLDRGIPSVLKEVFSCLTQSSDLGVPDLYIPHKLGKSG